MPSQSGVECTCKEQSYVRADRSNSEFHGVEIIETLDRQSLFSAVAWVFIHNNIKIKPELEEVLKSNNLIRSTAEIVRPVLACTPTYLASSSLGVVQHDLRLEFTL